MTHMRNVTVEGLKRLAGIQERQKSTPTLAFGHEEKPTRKGAFKVSSKVLKLWKDEVGKDTPHLLLFNRVRDAIEAIPRNDLPKAWGKDNIPDTQDFIAGKPKLAFQTWMRNVKKVSPKMQKYIQAVAENVPLVYYGFMSRISGKDMADIIFKRHFETKSGHAGELKRKKKFDTKKALKKQLKKQGIEVKGVKESIDEVIKRAHPSGLTPKTLVHYLGQRTGSTISVAELAFSFDMTPQAITKMVTKMVKAGELRTVGKGRGRGRTQAYSLPVAKTESILVSADWKRLAGIESTRPGLNEKKKTYPEAKKEIMDYLAKEGWKVSGPLKVPHATLDKDFRLWFKPQAVYYSVGHPHKLGDARTVSYDFDIRKMDGPKFLTTIERMFKKEMNPF